LRQSNHNSVPEWYLNGLRAEQIVGNNRRVLAWCHESSFANRFLEKNLFTTLLGGDAVEITGYTANFAAPVAC
jgi:hypothetical protein